VDEGQSGEHDRRSKREDARADLRSERHAELTCGVHAIHADAKEQRGDG
jgi:hypothetical protein